MAERNGRPSAGLGWLLGLPSRTTTTITATDRHPFWAPELCQWIDATNLQAGQWLETSAGTRVQITTVQHHTATQATVHNLTIANTHTYYVTAGDAPVLVHNCGNFATDDPGGFWTREVEIRGHILELGAQISRSGSTLHM